MVSPKTNQMHKREGSEVKSVRKYELTDRKKNLHYDGGVVKQESAREYSEYI